MKYLKRTAAAILAAAMLVCGVGASADSGGVRTAEAVFKKDGASVSGMKIRVGTEGTYSYTSEQKDGRDGWTITPQRGENSAVYVNLDKSFAYNIKDNSSFEIEVDYFDEGKGKFRIMYDGAKEPWDTDSNKQSVSVRKTDIVEISNKKEWKTHKFTIDNARFKDGYNHSDFAITLYEDAMGISLDDVTFGAVRIRPIETKGSVRVNLSTDAIGNNFFSTENVVINMDIYDKSGETRTLTATALSYDFYGEPARTDSFEITTEANGMTSRTIEFKPEKYSVYTMYLTVSGDGIFSQSKIEYSYVIENEKDNMFMGTNNHIYRLMTRDPDKIIPLLDRIGLAWNREGIWWDYYETTKGVYALPDRAQHSFDLFEKHGINQYMILDCLRPPLYGGGYPVGEVYETAFLEYVRDIATRFKGKVTNWELFNEVNAKVQEGMDTDWYVRMTKGVYKILKEIDKDNILVIGTTSGTPLEWIRSVASGAVGFFDGFSIHPYGMKVSPVESDRYSAVMSVREILDDCGAGDAKLYISEMGWSTGWVDYEHQAAFLAQIYAMLSSPELGVENIMYYDFQDDGFKPEDQENNFGVIRTWDTVDTPFIAKPSYLALSNINRLLTNAKLTDKKQIEPYSMYKFKAEDGKDVLMIWSRNENDYLTVSIGDNNAKVYDMLGNEKELYRKDGRYSMCVGNSPIYIVGNIDSYETGKAVFDISGTSFELPYNDVADIDIEKEIDDYAEVEFILDSDTNVEIIENNGFVGNKAKIKLRATGKSGVSENARLIIKDGGGKIFLDEKIVLKHTDMITVNFETKLFNQKNLNRWIGIMTIKNHNHTKAISGRAVFNAPSELSESIKSVTLSEIPADTEVKIMFNMPEVKFYSSYFIDLDVILDDGYTQKFNLYADCLAAVYAENKPTIDGYESDGEWSGAKALKIGEGREDYVPGTTEKYNGDNDLSATVKFMWDEENLYMFAVVTDDVMKQDYTPSNMWKGDSIQLGIHYGGILDPSVSLFTEIGLALCSGVPSIQRYSNESGASGVTKNMKFEGRRDGTKTYYEASMPWREIIMDGVNLKAGDAVRFNMIVNDNDNVDRWGWVEYSSGIGIEKDGTKFGRMNLIDNR